MVTTIMAAIKQNFVLYYGTLITIQNYKKKLIFIGKNNIF